MKSFSGTRILTRNLVNGGGGLFATPQDLGFQHPLAEILLIEGGVISETQEHENRAQLEPEIKTINKKTSFSSGFIRVS